MNLQNIKKECVYDIIKSNCLRFFNIIKCEYSLIKTLDEVNTKITPYSSYEVCFENRIHYRQFEISIVDYYSSITIFLTIYPLTQVLEKIGSISISDYVKKYLKIENAQEKFVLSNYEGETMDEKLDNFFKWFESVVDQKLINIFKGKDWVNIDFDWGPIRK